jgi:hypothetical protein
VLVKRRNVCVSVSVSVSVCVCVCVSRARAYIAREGQEEINFIAESDRLVTNTPFITLLILKRPLTHEAPQPRSHAHAHAHAHAQ